MFLDPNILDPKQIVLKENVDSKKIIGQKYVRSKILVPKSFGLKNCSVQKIWVEQNYGPIKLGPPKN